jgi:hypothetical protein
LNKPMTDSASALTLLYLSSGLLILCWLGAERPHQCPDLAGEQALETADDLGFGLALGGAASDVVPGRLVVLHADDDRPVERGVGLPVTASVEDAGTGATPQSRAQAGSERTRSMLSPATMSISAAVSGPNSRPDAGKLVTAVLTACS